MLKAFGLFDDTKVYQAQMTKCRLNDKSGKF